MNYKMETSLIGIEEIIDFLAKEGKEQLIRYGELNPMVIFVLQDDYNRRIFSQHLPGSEGFFAEGVDKAAAFKLALPKAMNLARSTMGSHLKLYAVIILTDTWVVKETLEKDVDNPQKLLKQYENDPNRVMPRDHPQREEAYCIVINFKDCSRQRMMPYKRVDGKIVFSEEEPRIGMTSGVLAGAFPDSEK